MCFIMPALSEMADVLGVDSKQLIAILTDPGMISQRMTGKSSTFEAYIELIGTRFGRKFDAGRVAQAKQIRWAFERRSLTPRAQTIATLTQLQTEGYVLGLLSNCTWELPELWPTTPFAPLFARPVFSCMVGRENRTADLPAGQRVLPGQAGAVFIHRRRQ